MPPEASEKFCSIESFNLDTDAHRLNICFVQTLFFFKILFIYLTEREITSRQRGRQREEEAGSLLSREPDAGLDPRTLRS